MMFDASCCVAFAAPTHNDSAEAVTLRVGPGHLVVDAGGRPAVEEFVSKSVCQACGDKATIVQ